MTDEKKKPQQDEVSDKDLEDVAGGAMRVVKKKIVRSPAIVEEEEGPVQT